MMRIQSLLVALALTAPTLVAAQWQWIDSGGRKVFSDRPPPSEVPERSILKRPGERAPLVFTPDAAPVPEPARVASAPRPAARDKDTDEQRRRQAEANETAQRKAEEERVARVRAENCTRVRQAKATLDSGIRLARVNDKGEREILDDTARAAEAKRLNDLVASECVAP